MRQNEASLGLIMVEAGQLGELSHVLESMVTGASRRSRSCPLDIRGRVDQAATMNNAATTPAVTIPASSQALMLRLQMLIRFADVAICQGSRAAASRAMVELGRNIELAKQSEHVSPAVAHALNGAIIWLTSGRIVHMGTRRELRAAGSLALSCIVDAKRCLRCEMAA